MKNIPADLNSDINSLENPRERGQVRQLTYAVRVLSGVVGVLFALIIKYYVANSGETSRRIIQLEEKVRIKDSLYTSCLIGKVRMDNEFIEREEKLKLEVSKSLRRQDTLFRILP